MISMGAYGMYKLFGNYAESMELHDVCLKEFKESPTSRKVIKNLPTMDIIKEELDNDDEEAEMTQSRNFSSNSEVSN